jgi:hypothetical protein
LGGFSATLTDAATLTYITTIGNTGWRGDQAYSHSIVLDVAVTERLNYVLQSDLLTVDETGENNSGINQYLLYAINDCWAAGMRFEWFKLDPVDYAVATFGVNYMPHANLRLRPEIRYNWGEGDRFDDTLFGMDAVFTF